MGVREARAVVRHHTPAPVLRTLRPLRDRWMRTRHAGDAVRCPVCGAAASAFAPFNGRDGARCPSCGALERHRLLWLYLDRCTDLFQRPQRVLHIAPESFLRDRLTAVHGEGYVHGDLGDPSHRLDVTALPHLAGAFDVIICAHVLEHVPDDGLAMRELLRVLSPHGWAILDAPVDERRDTTYEDWSITEPARRRQAFGQWDHVRVYGRDYAERLSSAGWRLDVDPWQAPPDDVRRYGLRPGVDRLYRATPAAP